MFFIQLHFMELTNKYWTFFWQILNNRVAIVIDGNLNSHNDFLVVSMNNANMFTSQLNCASVGAGLKLLLQL